ncbi:MAG: L,D-transpeptidase [Zoogloeaceae bacterium]|jgi:lipoprotein-anchoring transpeptidase ErfK/SrfK|nr:L,D-transpeptidase [Zoogloeaceae bacterium]
MKIHISLSRQTLRLTDDAGCLIDGWPVSTSANGAGETENSGCTPRGRHRVDEKIGEGMPAGTVFVGRVPTGEIWSPALAAEQPERDWILARILWLAGCEPGFNQGPGCDTKARYIYIHGTGDDAPMGEPHSHGCIRMKTADVIRLFALTPTGTPVDIEE